MKDKGLPPNSIRKLGWGMVQIVPYLMRLLSVLGTAAMFLVGGGIIAHGIPQLHALAELALPWSLLVNAGIGILTGAVCFMLITGVKLFIKKD